MMGVKSSSFTQSTIEVEVLRERQKHFKDRIRHLEQDLTQAYTDLRSKEKALEQIKNEREDLKIKGEVLKKDLQHMQNLITKNNQITKKKGNAAKSQAFIACLIFLMVSVLVNFATNILTSNFPNQSFGWVILVAAAFLYVVGTLMTTLFNVGGS